MSSRRESRWPHPPLENLPDDRPEKADIAGDGRNGDCCGLFPAVGLACRPYQGTTGNGIVCAARGGSGMAKFFAELKRRHVYRVAAAYAVVAWVLLQFIAN